ncbi:MFS transporter [Gaeumannomyces tritici R3-111a-1]|uniref:MFS transporter n=1 Tax=Gaeumannomyces tritici (strain R3-111a-1) TaxID=644352 RepID=J3NQS8_GAET3|nr:MFS transporter [Gaeumannomyces tritici R3-111a-1]EJT78534.1 MFS transporter [Gaeumannomyces tritici R3-111a-1]
MSPGGHPDGTSKPAVAKSGPEDRKNSLASNVAKDVELQISTARVLDPAAERALCRKFDFRLLPVLAFLYLLNALDKGNIGNAETAGFSKDLSFAPGQYNLILAIFFVPFVIFAPPISIIGKKYGPARVLPCLAMVFGSMTLLTAAARSFSGIFALRWFLGMAESAVFPLVIYYLTTFYRRGELARRLAIFYAAANIANAFSGLLAFAVFRIESHLVDFSWRWLFIIEGTITVLFAVFAYWYLPLSASQASFLNEEEKALAFHRISVDSSSTVEEGFNLRKSLVIFRQPATYGFLLIEICVGVPSQAVNLFMPQIIQRLGYGTIQTNLFTVAPNITGAVMLLILAFTSDWLRLRSPFVALGFILTCMGFAIYAAIDNIETQLRLGYYATFMMCWGTSAPSVLLSTWYNNNIAHEGQRLVLTSVGVPLANLMGLVSSNVFRKEDAPKYEPALITTACFGAAGATVAAAMGLWMVWDNRARNRSQGVNLSARDVPTHRLRDGPKVDEFRWFL